MSSETPNPMGPQTEALVHMEDLLGSLWAQPERKAQARTNRTDPHGPREETIISHVQPLGSPQGPPGEALPGPN